MEFSVEQIRMLAENERAMDSGAQPFVRDNKGNRWAFKGSVLDMLGCVSGQTVSAMIIQALMEANLAAMEAAVAIDGFKRA